METKQDECINLREQFGRRYKVWLEEPAKSYADPWYHVIACRSGHIYPHGGDRLGFASKTRGTAKRVAALPYAIVEQDGDDGMNITFPVDRFDEVAAIVHPRRRRAMSEERLRNLAEAGRAFRFVSGAGDGQTGTGRDLAGSGDSEPIPPDKER